MNRLKHTIGKLQVWGEHSEHQLRRPYKRRDGQACAEFNQACDESIRRAASYVGATNGERKLLLTRYGF